MAFRISSPILMLCSLLLAVSRALDQGSGPMYCSTSGNQAITKAYTTNLNQFLAALPKTVPVNGGFFNGTVGHGADTVYGLAMCFADFSPADCSDCLAAVSSSTDGLVKLCPSSTTVAASFDQCMVRYSDDNFFGTAETGVVGINFNLTFGSTSSSNNPKQSLGNLSAQAATSPQRFAASETAPYTLVQCTWDLAPDKCKACIDALSTNSSNMFDSATGGEVKSFSCRLRYSNSNFTVVPPVAPRVRTSQPVVNHTGASSSPPSTSSPPSFTVRSSNNKSKIAGAVIGGTFGAGCLIGVLICITCKIRNKQQQQTVAEGDLFTQRAADAQQAREVSVVRNFSYAQLSLATDNFSESKKLGSGSFGVVYKGHLADLGSVAVKKIGHVTEQAISDYSREINTVSLLRHRNLVRLMGSCNERGELLLVYELIGNRSLEDHLHRPNASGDGTRIILSWNRRYKIALGMAEALSYLHKNFVVHRDIKPSNVLLDGEFIAKVGDYGLVTEVDPDRTSQAMSIRGYIKYMDPEYELTGKAGPASDVYSFGLVLLEMVSGKKPTSSSSSSNTNQTAEFASSQLAEKIRAALQSKNPMAILTDVVDPRLKGGVSPIMDQIFQMQRVLRLGLLCVQFDHRLRPTSEQVHRYLTGEDPLPPDDEQYRNLPNTTSVNILLGIRVRVYVPRPFTKKELSEATSEFSHLLGRGSYGAVYKGTLQDDLGTWNVAVKKLHIVNTDTTRDYRREIEVISELRHQNLLRLMGWCHDGGELLLVYEEMKNGCLSEYLSTRNDDATDVNQGRSRQPLDWTKRYNIIVGIAKALRYIHYDCPFQKKRVLHRDIKPSNVMLDDSFEAKLGDFGLMRQVDSSVPQQTLTFGGTLAYVEPEYFETKKVSLESDVYSFGVVVLQMVLGVKPSYIAEKEGPRLRNYLVENAFAFYHRGEILREVDKQFKGQFDQKQMKRVIHVGLLCVQADRKERPNSSQALFYLTEPKAELPPVPSAGVTPGASASTVGSDGSPAGPSSSAPSISRQQSHEFKTCQGDFN